MISLAASLVLSCVVSAEPANNYRIGRAASDITLPVWGVQMLGYVHPDQIGQGLRQRQYARTFVIADIDDRSRLAYVTCDIAFATHTLKLAVLERLQKSLPDRYTHANLILAGTHTHGAPGGYHHHLSTSVLGGDFFVQAFNALVEGVTESIMTADADLRPGRIILAQGEVAEANANRSLVAYRNNPADERAAYKNDVDKTMTLLKFVRDDGTIGLLNWFAVHPTSVNFHYCLTTSDNKGYAAYLIEEAHGVRHRGGPEFVAAFANTNCGDATPNLNLDATGPGQTDLESCTMIGRRQADVAQRLCDGDGEALAGPIQALHTFVDFSRLEVEPEFTAEGGHHTCPSAWGYAFAAGSEAEGGGIPVFREGMTKSDPAVDAVVRLALPQVRTTPEFLECQKPKAVLIASGLANPPMHEQVLPLALVRIGQLAFVVGPAEFTTMSGRRFRAAVARELGIDPRYVIVAGYSNDFAGYVTTWHEYQLQQYEGGHTLFGPWTEAGYRQEFVRLARALKAGKQVAPTGQPADMRSRVAKPTLLDGPDENQPAGARFGDVAIAPKREYAAGDVVSAVFWTGSPVNDYRRQDRYLAVERLTVAPDTWEVVREDFDWDTTAQWARQGGAGKPSAARSGQQMSLLNLAPPKYKTSPEAFQVTITWESSKETPPGTYRLVHFGRCKEGGEVKRFTARTPAFELK
jgi:neutral ceramidase